MMKKTIILVAALAMTTLFTQAEDVRVSDVIVASADTNTSADMNISN